MFGLREGALCFLLTLIYHDQLSRVVGGNGDVRDRIATSKHDHLSAVSTRGNRDDADDGMSVLL